MYDCRYWLWLSLALDQGSTRLDKLLHAFNYDPRALYEADRSSYEPFCTNHPRSLNALTNKSMDEVYKVLDFCEKNNVGILTYDDDKYPSPLRAIQGKPPVIYYKGTVPDFSKNLSISIVGTRNVTSYGSSAAYTISHDLASAGAIIVSGMALGTDTAAHRGALDAKGTTVAFLGCGINVVYPKENAKLMDEIIATGAVMTDYPPFSRPEGRHFPVRNRLISGVSHGVLIVEAAKKSGALITANHALNQGKLLYAIPGRIGELTSEGSNELLMTGAQTVTKSSDILDDFRTLFNITETKNQSGFTQYKTSPMEDLSIPYKTPTFNPYANKQNSYSPKENSKNFYDKFQPMPKQAQKEQESVKEPDRAEFNEPRFYDPSRELRGNQNSLRTPRPIIIYSDFDDEKKESEAYMSLSDEDKADLENIDILAHRPVLRYRKDPIPPGGYEVHLTKEKIAQFEQMEEESRHRRISIKDGFKIEPSFPGATLDPKKLKEFQEMDKRLYEERERKKAEAALNGQEDYSGLSDLEVSALKLIKNGGKVTVDAMDCLGIPLPRLLSMLTVLEVKQRIVQLPGGYFCIKEDK